MKDLTQVRVASVAAALLGIWAVVSPLFISVTGAALTNLIVTGSVLVLFSLAQLFVHNGLPSGVTALAGVWLFVSAFAFTVSGALAASEILVGMAAIIFAIWDSYEVEQSYHHQARPIY